MFACVITRHSFGNDIVVTSLAQVTRRSLSSGPSRRSPARSPLTPRELGFTEDVVLYEYFSGTGVRLHADQSYAFTLPDNDAVLLFSLTPYRGCPCVIGLSEKMIAAKTWQRRPDGGILPRCDGTLVVYSETPIVGAHSSGKGLYRLPVRGGQVVDPLS